MCKVAVRLVVLFLLASAIAPTSHGQVDRASIDRLVEPYIRNHIVSGLVVGVTKDGQRESIGYGVMSDDDPRRPDGKTVFEIGSTSKVFTGLLLADAVVREKVSLDHKVQDLLPDDVQLVVKDQPILLRHLATHSSGLPRIPDNMNPADPMNPYADYSVKLMYEFLSNYKPPRAPGEEYEYSNLGAGLLGHALARKAGKSYEQLLRERITGPLKMTSTAIELTPSMRQRLAPPQMADGTPAANWDVPTLAGAGAIRSTVDDLLLFLDAQLQPPEGELGAAIQLAWDIHRKPAEPGEFAMGLGWHVAHDRETRWHNGGTGGYHSMMLAARSIHAGVVVLCNSASFEIDRLAEDITKMLGGMPVEPRSFEQPKEVQVAPEVLKRYEGRYEIVPEFVLTVTTDGKALFVQATNQPKFRVFAKSETEFFLKVVDAKLTFTVDDDGRCNLVTLHQGGQDMPAKRVD